MKIRVNKNLNPLSDSFQLTKHDIESQVLNDLSKYRKLYQIRYGKPISTKLDVDNFVSELWGFSISIEPIPQEHDKEILGFIRPETRQIVIHEDCTNQKRFSFTVGHEAGHISLHGMLFKKDGDIIIGWKDIPKSKNKKKLKEAECRREWQANVYAGALLAPKIEIQKLLEELELIKNSNLLTFNLDDHFASFDLKFGLSRQALEIRLKHLNIPFQGARY
jgi:Zn-dependent peptidase ImmA (M78 family)